MAIRRKGNAWQVDISDGRSRRIRQAARTETEARELEAALRERVRRQRLGLPIAYTLDDALARWLREYSPRLKAHQSYLSCARNLRPYLAGRRLDQVADVASDLRRKYRASPATINRRLALLRRIARLAYTEWGWLDKPLWQRVRLLPERNARHIYLLPHEIERLALACRHLGAASAVLLAGYTGLRQGELLRLDLDSYRDGWLYIGIDTKTGRPRAVPVPEQARDIAEELPLPVSKMTLVRRFAEARQATGLTHVRFHDLRHSYASLLAAAGVPLKTVGELLGHASVATTNRYAHLAAEHLAEAVKKLVR